MSSQIPFPNKRLAQAGIGNPLFVTDIENATEDLLEALATLYGFASNGFAILSGFDYGAGAYTGGIVYMNGVFYRCVAGLTENQYLTPDVQDVQNKIFSDANTYPTYRIYQAVASGAQWGGMPQFVGNMNSYRVSIKKVYDTFATFGNIVTHNTSEFDAAGAAAAAQSTAISTAASDATTKADNAISVAASDATSKANAAQTYALNTVGGSLLTKYIDYFGWNMDTTDSHFVNVSSLGILASKVKEITASVIDSIGAPSSLLGSNGSMRTTSLSGSNIGGITLYRVTGGLFDNVNFNNASGSIVIRYLP